MNRLIQALVCAAVLVSLSAQAREVVIRSADGASSVLYTGSHALVIGASEYVHPSWNDLTRVPAETREIAEALRAQGFEVETVPDPSGEELRQVIRNFVVEHGQGRRNRDNRLLIFFSGHGHTRGEDRGYLVPVDAPDPNIDEQGFLLKALSMGRVNTWATEIEAKHALFVFDSCFSGTIFERRSRGDATRAYIGSLTGKPVRQFITAGDAGQEVPAASIFAKVFLEGLAGDADFNGDDYVTGRELGLYVQQDVPRYTSIQTPQSGTILDPDLDDGDFVFELAARPVDPVVDDAPSARDVEEAQAVLSGLGYDPGPTDGIMGLRTRGALIRFQEDRDLSATGDLDRATRQALVRAWADDAPERGLRVRPSQSEEQLAVGLPDETHSPPHESLEIFRDQLSGGGMGPEMIALPGGEFRMGSPETEEGRDNDEGPQRLVTVGRFALARTEVTFDQWEACVEGGGCKANPKPNDRGWGRGNRPVINVSWTEAQQYVKWLSEQTGSEYRLPSEAEWEYAARAGTETPFAFGETISTDQANYDGRSAYGDGTMGEYHGRTVPVTDLDAANEWGLRHMHGNVWEWVEDCWHGSYEGAPGDASAWLEADGGNCSWRVLRGGSWHFSPRNLRSASRDWLEPDARSNVIGFRPARTLLTP